MSDLENQHEIVAYVKEHPVIILGTVDKLGHPYGAAVYAYASSADLLYIVTKTETQKFKNIIQDPHVSVTIADSSNNSSLQARGKAHVIDDARVIEMVMGHMAHIYARGADGLPPIAKLIAGGYQVIGIKISHARLDQFKGKHIGSPTIFKES